ncbi:MAG: DUF6640 family protein [Sphingorhabdus sp.]
MQRRTIGRWLLGFVITATVVVVAIADVFNATHLFNPAWPPHARFHNAMQAGTLLLMSAASLWGLARHNHVLAALAPATFWPGLFIALPVPGTSVHASPELAQLPIPINLAIAAASLALTALGYWLASSDKRVAPEAPRPRTQEEGKAS